MKAEMINEFYQLQLSMSNSKYWDLQNGGIYTLSEETNQMTVRDVNGTELKLTGLSKLIQRFMSMMNNRLIVSIKKVKKATLFFALFLLFFSANLFAQEKMTKYNVLQNGDVIGQMQFYKKNTGDDLYLKISSHIKTRFIVGISVDIEERAHFKNGELMSSNVVRHVNGKQKANKQTQFMDNRYQIRSDDKISQIKASINYNLMLLYINEPISLSRVYSDNFQQFLEVKQTKPHTYRIVLPDGNYNDYYFNKGICQEVAIHHSLYTINIQLA